MGSTNLFLTNSALGPTGGHGGGAIELVAANDLIIGSFGSVFMKGGDGNQTSEGGGGGGSGGAVLLSSGNSLLISGKLDASGGNGGYGGLDSSLAGGGGGGGRIAMYGESITINGSISVEGGRCGVYKLPSISVNVTALNVSVYMVMISKLDDKRLSFLGSLFIKNTLNVSNVIFIDLQKNILLNHLSY